MRTQKLLSTLLSCATAIAPLGCGGSSREPARPTPAAGSKLGPTTAGPEVKATPVAAVARSGVVAKPVSDTVRKGLTWLVQHQLASGGWGQGDEAPAQS